MIRALVDLHETLCWKERTLLIELFVMSWFFSVEHIYVWISLFGVCVFLRDTHNIELFTDIKQYIFKSVKWTLETSWSGSAVAT